MSKRRVPAALHHELSEYTSLLRALRTKDTLDITKHLTKPSPFALPPHANSSLSDESVDLDDAPPEPSVAAPSSPRGDTPSSSRTGSGSGIRKGKARVSTSTSANKGKAKQIQRDHWTRWPLMLEDVPKPEWNLEDEVAVISSQILKTCPPTPSLSDDQDENQTEADESDEEMLSINLEVEEDDPEHPYYVPGLTYVTANFLSAILAELASHIPARAASLQNRNEPLSWRAVIEAVVSCEHPEISDPTVIGNVVKRMERLYGTSAPTRDGPQASGERAVARAQLVKEEKRTTSDIFKSMDDLLFTQTSAPEQQLTSFQEYEREYKRKTRKRLSKAALREQRDFVFRKNSVSKHKLQAAREPSPSEASTSSKMEVDADPDQDAEAGPSSSSVRRSSRAKPTVRYFEPAVEG